MDDDLLGRVLLALHTAGERWTSVHAVVRRHTDLRAREAVSRAASGAFFGRPQEWPPGAGDDEGPAVRDTVLDVLAAADGRARVDERDADAGRRLWLTVVVPGTGSLSVDEDGVVDGESSWHDRGLQLIRLEQVGTLLWPAGVLGVCHLTVTGTDTVAGRRVVTALARVRDGAIGDSPFLFGYGVPRAELAVDLTTGLVLRLVGTDEHGLAVDGLEVVDLEVDAAVADDAFSLEPPPGSVTSDDARGPLPPAQAAARVPFRLLVPPAAADDLPWTVQVVRRRRGDRPVTAHLHRLGVVVGEGRLQLTVLQAGDPTALPDVTEWTPVRVGDRDAHTWSASDGATHLVAWREGTGVWIRDAESLDAATAVLDSLEPVTPAH